MAIKGNKQTLQVGWWNSSNKGYFADITALQTAIPVWQNGWFAVLWSTDTIWIWDTDTTAWKNSWTAGGGWEANTASNIGTAGVWLLKQKTGVNFELKKINASSSKVTITDDIVNNEVDIDVVPANFTGIPNTSITGLGTLSTQNGTFSGSSSGTNTWDQTITLTGEATWSGTWSFAVTIVNSAVIAKLLTGFTAWAWVVSATDSILSAFQKIVGNISTLVTGVSTVFGRSGAVIAISWDYNTSQVTENTNFYFTVARVLSSALTGFTVTGTRTAIVATDTVLQAFSKIQKYFNDLSSLAFSWSATDLTGTKTSAFISDFNAQVASLITGKQDALTLTTTGTSWLATLIWWALNIPQYAGWSGWSVTQTAIVLDFWANWVDAKTFTITDALATTTSKIQIACSWIGWGRADDELEFEQVNVSCIPTAWSIKIIAKATWLVTWSYKFNYLLS